MPLGSRRYQPINGDGLSSPYLLEREDFFAPFFLGALRLDACEDRLRLVFFAADLLPVEREEDFFAVFRADFFVADFFVADFFAAFFLAGGTLAPAFLASERPIAMACFGLVTFFPLLPDFN